LILHAYAFTDEINFGKLKKVLKNLIKGVKIWTLVTKAVNRQDKLSRRYRDRDLAKFESSRRYRQR
jgi:hypothetical protein